MSFIIRPLEEAWSGTLFGSTTRDARESKKGSMGLAKLRCSRMRNRLRAGVSVTVGNLRTFV